MSSVSEAYLSSLRVGTRPMRCTILIPLDTRPKMLCLPGAHATMRERERGKQGGERLM